MRGESLIGRIAGEACTSFSFSAPAVQAALPTSPGASAFTWRGRARPSPLQTNTAEKLAHRQADGDLQLSDCESPELQFETVFNPSDGATSDSAHAADDEIEGDQAVTSATAVVGFARLHVATPKGGTAPGVGDLKADELGGEEVRHE